MSETAFKPVSSRDTEEIATLWAACDLTRPWNPPEDDIALALRSAEADILAARDGDRIVATVMIGQDGHRAWVYYVAVDPAWRRRGLGRAAMLAAERWAQDRGVPKLHLMIRPENRTVMAFYEALGYEDGRIVTMQKWLDPERAAVYAPRQR